MITRKALFDRLRAKSYRAQLIDATTKSKKSPF